MSHFNIQPLNVLSTVLALALAQSPLAAEPMERASSFTEVIDVEVVGLEVYVTGPNGDPVDDLTRADFELWADGELVDITNFYAVEDGRKLIDSSNPSPSNPPSSPAIPSDPEPLFLVVYVDNAHVDTFNRNRLLKELSPFLKQRLNAGDQIMVATFDGAVDLRQSFTDDWKAVGKALDEVATDPGFGHEREREHTRTIENIISFSDLHASMPLDSLRTRCPREIESVARSYANQVYSRVHSSAERLGDFVESLGSLPGRKAVMHVSDGLHLLPGVEVFEYLCQLCGNCPRESPDIAEPNPRGESVNPRIELATLPALAYDGNSASVDGLASEATQVFRNLTERANAHRVTFFTLEAYGPRNLVMPGSSANSRATSAAVERARISSLQGSLKTMADKTGGRTVLNTREMPPELARIGEDFDSYYSLGYSLPRSREGRDLRIRVEVRRPGIEVRYRKSLHTQPLSEQLANRTRAALMYGVGQNPLDVTLEIGKPEALDKSLHMVPIQVSVPLDNVTLLPEQGLHKGQLTVYLAARDRSGRLAPVRTADVTIGIPEDKIEDARSKPYLYVIRMLMRQGDHTVAVGVHDDFGRSASYLIRDVTVN